MVELVGSMEFMPSNKFKQDMGIEMCQATSPYADMCANEVFLIGGYDSEQLDYVSGHQRGFEQFYIIYIYS